MCPRKGAEVELVVPKLVAKPKKPGMGKPGAAGGSRAHSGVDAGPG